MRTGAFTSFADWRFVHRARLNLLPLNGARMWGAPDRDQRCRVCGYLRETLPHVVCHCMPRSALYRARHNAIVDRVRTAASREFTVAFENQAVGDTGLRPDLVLVRGEEAIVIDVTCPFENTPDAFENARNAKLAHYEPVAAFLRRRYQRVTVHAVIVGALGAWDSANDRVLRRICSRPYLRLFKKLCVGPGVTSSRRRPPGLAAKEVFQPPGSCRSSLQSLASGPGPSCSVTPAPCLATHGPGPRLLPRLLPSRRLPLCYQISDPAPAEPVY
nr:uncharacterized protein LOC119168652 [Rhipicephalus microplus]